MIWIIDTQRRDWAGLAKHIPCRLIRKSHGCFNPLQPPPGCPAVTWFQAIAFVFCQAFGLHLASQLFMFKMLIRTCNALDQQGRFPTLKDMEIAYSGHKSHSADGAGYRSRTLEKLEPLLLACPELDYEVGFDLSFFLRQSINVIWEASDDEDIRAFFALWQVYYLYHYRVNNRETEGEDVFVFLDECLHPFRARSLEGGLPLSSKLVTQLRGVGVALIILTQLPGMLDQAARANLSTTITFQNRAEQAIVAARIQALSRDAQEMIPNLPIGQGILTIGGDRLEGPVLLDTPLYPHEVIKMSDKELNQISEASTRDLLPHVKKSPKRVVADAPPARDPNRLSADGERLLYTYENKPTVMRLVGEQLKWSPTKLSRLTNEIVKGGVWLEGPIIGHNNKTFVLTSGRGVEYCQRWGIRTSTEKSGRPNHDRVHQIGNNSVQMNILQRCRGTRSQTKGTAYQVSGDRKVEVDGLIFGPGQAGPRTALQFAYRNAVRYEAANLVRLARMGPLGPDHVLCVAHSAAHMRAIDQHVDRILDRLHKRPPGDQQRETGVAGYRDRIRRKIKLMHLDEVLDEATNLSWIKRGES